MSADIDESGLIEFATELARTPSVSGSEGAAVELAAARFRALGFDDVEIDRAGNAVGYIGSGSGPRLLIDGHIDTIPLHSAERWTVDPFGGQIIDGRLFGLGICDQKASIAAAAYGLAAARRAGVLGGSGSGSGPAEGTVALVASVCEEACEGAALASVAERFAPDMAITTEPNDTRLCIGQRGRAKLWVRVTGRACHAGHSGEGVNAAEALAEVIAAVRRVAPPTHPRLGRRDITCIDIASSPYPSVSTVPGEALARFDCRFLPGETPESLCGVLRDCAVSALAGWPEQPVVEVGVVDASFTTWTGASFSVPEFEPAWWTDEDSDLVTGVQKALSTAGLSATPTHYSFCTNGSYLAGVAGIPTIGFGVGLEHIAHQADEYVTLDSLRKGARGFAAIAAQLVAGG
jgi:putative selenium metabolism hydrolase